MTTPSPSHEELAANVERGVFDQNNATLAAVIRRLAQPPADATESQQQTHAVQLLRDHPGVDHIWLNAFACISPTDEFAADLGRRIIHKVVSHGDLTTDILDKRHIAIRINAS